MSLVPRDDFIRTGNTRLGPGGARDTHEAWRNDLRGTHMVYMGSPEREEATFLLLPRATSCI
jgi:hypothetical protein